MVIYFHPFFILLLWYPCFENLFSIIRKFNFKNLQLVQIINICINYCLFLKKKLNFKNKFINNFSSTIINLYNLIIFYLASFDIFNSRIK